MQPRTQLSSAIFIPEEMRNGILERNEIANMIDPNPNPEMPSEIDSYHSLYALEPQPIHQKLPLPSSTYKATHNTTGVKYCLRRLHGSYSINFRIFLTNIKWIFFKTTVVLSNWLLIFSSEFRLSNTIHEVYDRGRSMEEIPALKCCTTSWSIYYKGVWWSM